MGGILNDGKKHCCFGKFNSSAGNYCLVHKCLIIEEFGIASKVTDLIKKKNCFKL